jgi:hypothetical protein
MTTDAAYEGPKDTVFPADAERKVEVYLEQTDWVAAHRNLSTAADLDKSAEGHFSLPPEKRVQSRPKSNLHRPTRKYLVHLSVSLSNVLK